MISSKTNSSKLDLKSSDWELDFYSRPIIEKTEKKMGIDNFINKKF